jgi:hypothetical protein
LVVLAAFFFNLSLRERSKSFGAFSGVFDISSAVWSIVYPILGCDVVGCISEALVLYMSTIIDLFP